MSHLALTTFGTLRVALDGTPITSFATDKARALLVYLAVEAARPHRRETLAHLLWPDLPDRDARHNLSQALWHLRQALGERDSATPLLLTSRDTVQFNPRRSLSVDVTEFTRLLTACDTCTATTSAPCAVCLPRLQQAAALYQGDFLAQITLGHDSPFDEWALHWRERLHQQALRLFGTLADLAEQRGDDEEARAFLTRQLELEPWREEAHRALMRLLARTGERSAALAQYATCRRVLADELGIEPASETTQVYEQIHDMPVLPATPTPALRLPTPATAFLGRAQELADLSARLTDPACRLLTLLGPGGIGKTRLALQAAADLAQHLAFPGGVVWVPLAPVAAAEHVAAALASALQLPHQAALPLEERLLTALRDRTLLLILDNLEHVLDVVPLLARIIAEAPGVTLLATSRERLGLAGEWVYALDGLPTPASDADTRTAPAALLFLDRAKQVDHQFALTVENVPFVRRICQCVEGMPLGIELAASWVRVLSCAEIAADLERGLDLLSANERGGNPRHPSMRVVFDHSWQLLTPTEQAVLARLSVFRGGATREALAAVCAEAIAGPLLPILATLIDKSLVRRTTDTTGATRYGLHDLIRQYAAARLAEQPADQAAAAARHAAFYAAWVAQQESILKSAQQKQAVWALVTEIDNIRAVWQWACDQRDARVLLSMFFTLDWFYEVRGWNAEATALFAQGNAALHPLALLPAAPNEVQTCYWLLVAREGWHTQRRDPAFAARRMHEGITALRQVNRLGGLAHVIKGQAYLQIFVGDYTGAEESLAEGLALAEQINNPWACAVVLVIRGILETLRSDTATAQHHLQEALTAARMVGDPRLVALTLNYMGVTALMHDHLDEAEQACRECLALAAENQDRFQTSLGLQTLGRIALQRGDVFESERLLTESLSIAREIGDRWLEARAFGRLGTLANTQGDRTRARQLHRQAVKAAVPLPDALDELAALIQFELDEQPEAALTALAYLLQHPLTRPAIRAQLRECWQTAQATFPAELLAASEAAAHAFATQPPVALLSCFTLTPHLPAAPPLSLAADHTSDTAAPDLPDPVQSSAMPAP